MLITVMSSAEENHLGPILISDDSHAVNFGIANGIFQGSEYMNAEDRLSSEDGPTIDLLQLSSHASANGASKAIHSGEAGK
ncbi:hypothetical protein F0562_025025 [Nyssa sinensis]|uniref:Uncharacterized protein n=1 Tax=Nyssa sinensis TaxID=561372 RepID=A0A5J5BGT6_9ASTE|nr:hypothetical protein F0562_025025 [Nyssa sinensis]